METYTEQETATELAMSEVDASEKIAEFVRKVFEPHHSRNHYDRVKVKLGLEESPSPHQSRASTFASLTQLKSLLFGHAVVTVEETPTHISFEFYRTTPSLGTVQERFSEVQI